VPTSAEHRQRAEHNLQFAQSFNLETTPYIDWVATAYFYAALHWVDALLWKYDRYDPGCHEHRGAWIKRVWYLRAIKDDYFDLKDYSENARYRLITVTRTRLEEKIIPKYKNIEQHCLQQLEERNENVGLDPSKK
jgi:uncharacterized protein (UPF0332 family)